MSPRTTLTLRTSCSFDGLLSQSARLVLGSERTTYWRVIQAVRRSSDLLNSSPKRGRSNPHDTIRVIRACVRIARYRWAWRRLPEEWTAPTANPFEQFRSLVTHLFDAYPVPRYMMRVWLEDEERQWELNLYLHLAAGYGIRGFMFPFRFPLSRRGTAYTMQAPDDLTITAALRWGQIRSLGGDTALARLLACQTILGSPTAHEEFWETVIRFLIANQPITNEESVSIVEFVHQQRFLRGAEVWGPFAGQAPLQPEFSLQGRTMMSLRRHMVHWRDELRARLSISMSSAQCRLWDRTDITPFRWEQEEGVWTIDELLTNHELHVEGNMMMHCVASYAHRCAQRRTSIWSLKRQEGTRRARILTLEVIPHTRTIVQIKGKRNAPPTTLAANVVKRWATQAGLVLSNWCGID